MALGEWDIDRLYRDMPASVFAQWLAYDQVEPIGMVMNSALLAQLNATLVNVHRDPKKTGPVAAKDFLPKVRDSAETRNGKSAWWSWFKTWALAHNASIKNDT